MGLYNCTSDISSVNIIPINNNNVTDIDVITALSDGTDNRLVNAYTAKRWANCDVISLLVIVSQGTNTIGDWEDDWKSSGASRSGWLWSEDLYGVLSDDSIEITPVFDIGNNEVVSVYALRIDDDVDQTVNGQTVHGGAVAIKFNGTIQNSSGIKVGLNLKKQRINVKSFNVIS